MIALVDLRISNVGSIRQALARAGCRDTVEATASSVLRADALIIPGVGSFGDGMASLREQGLIEPIRQAARAGMPVMGICLGMQLLASESEEHGHHEGLGLVEGRVVTLAPTDPNFRVPNIGWCDVQSLCSGVLFADRTGGCFYHVHSYHLVPKDRRVIAATINYSGQDIAVAVEQENIFGVQFHPEKSQDDGLDLLARFVGHATASVHGR